MKKHGFLCKEHSAPGRLAGWLAGGLAGWLAGGLAGWLAGGLAGWSNFWFRPEAAGAPRSNQEHPGATQEAQGEDQHSTGKAGRANYVDFKRFSLAFANEDQNGYPIFIHIP